MSNSPVETPLVLLRAGISAENKFIYNGYSMTPYFKVGDLLYGSCVEAGRVSVGDIVIVFRGESSDHFNHYVHRVVHKKGNRLVTRGDNNQTFDTLVVTEEYLFGLVTHYERMGRIFPVRGGFWGQLYARTIYLRNRCWRLIEKLGVHFYRWLRQSGLVARLWRPTISRICVKVVNGYLVKYCYRNRTVARWWPVEKHFDVIKPFDLVISSPELPK